MCFHRSKEKEQHAQCCSCGTLDAAQVAPQRCLILHLRESNYIIFDYQPEFNRLEKGLEELLPPLFLQWQVPVKTYWNWNLLFQLTLSPLYIQYFQYVKERLTAALIVNILCSIENLQCAYS